MSNLKRYQYLASKWLNGTITKAEKIEFSQWYNSHSDEKIFIPTSFAKDESALRERILLKVRQGTHLSMSRRISLYSSKRVAIAVSLAVFILCGIGYFLHLRSDDNQIQTVELDKIQPGGNKATLTLTDGRIIDLSEQQSGLIIGDNIQYLDGSSLLGEDRSQDGNKALSYVTLSTPKGGQYQATLPDGTQIWLNSASSVKFPSRFEDAYREVELLAGEAFFKVKPYKKNDFKIPFYVKNGHQLVEVLGTQFNINAYEVQAGVVTTVVEGSVAVQPFELSQDVHKSRVVLTSGDQSVIKGAEVSVLHVDSESFTAWKDGYFYFNDADIYTVMKEFERWYDIEVKYEISKSDDLFVGKIPRKVTLGTALSVLKKAGVSFEMSDYRYLVVKNKTNN